MNYRKFLIKVHKSTMEQNDIPTDNIIIANGHYDAASMHIENHMSEYEIGTLFCDRPNMPDPNMKRFSVWHISNEYVATIYVTEIF